MSVALRGRARRAIFGYRSGTWNVGYAITSLLGGIIIVRWGYNPTFTIYAITMLIAMTLFYVFTVYISPVGDARTETAQATDATLVVPDRAATRSPDTGKTGEID